MTLIGPKDQWKTGTVSYYIIEIAIFVSFFIFYFIFIEDFFLFRHYIIIIFLEFLIRKNCFSSLIKLCFKFWHMTGDKKILSYLIMSLYYMSKFQVKMYRGSSHGVEKEPGETILCKLFAFFLCKEVKKILNSLQKSE